MTTGLTSSRRDWTILAAAFMAIVAVAAVWVAIDRRPPDWDHANHLERAVLCAQDLARGDVRAIVARSSFYPPLVTCAAGVVYWLAPSDTAGAESILLAFLGLGMASTYLVGHRLVNGAAGVAAALAFGTAPFVLYSMLRFQLDLPLAAMVASTLYAGLRSEHFTRRDWAIVTGVIAGLGLLTKPPFVVYAAPPLLVLVLGGRSGRAWVNAALTTAIAAAVSLPWYGPRLFALSFQVGNRSFKQAAESGHPDPLSWAGLSFYPRWLIPQLGVLAVLLLLAGLVLAIRRGQWFLPVAVLVPFMLFVMLQNKNLRYTLPLLPAAAVLAGTAIAALARPAQIVAIAAVILAGAVQVSAVAFGVPSLPAVPGIGVPWLLTSAPSTEDWKQRDILALIARHSGAVPVTVSVVPNVAWFAVSNFRYYAVRDGRGFGFVRAWDEPIGIEYMVLKTGAQGPTWTTEKSRRAGERVASDPDLARVFPVVGEFPLPDGSTATVRARTMTALTDVKPAVVAEAIDGAVRAELAAYARDVDRFGLTLDYDDGILAGRVRRLTLAAGSASVGELRKPAAATLRVHDVRVVIEDALVNPFAARSGRLQLLDARRVSIQGARITGPDLQAFLRGLKRFQRSSVTLADGTIDVVIRGRGPEVEGRVRILPGTEAPFAIDAERVRFGVVTVPSALVNWVVRAFDPAPRLAMRIPVPVELGRITVTPDAIRVTPRGGS